MYLRFGWVLGQVGLFKTLIIVTLSTSITFLTALSLSALATNMRVGGGGAYYIISRSLGLEMGAAVGIPLFFAQALGISFYVSGFSESIINLYPYLDPKLLGVLTLLIIAYLAYKSADLALKSQFIILTLIILSLGSFFLGGTPPPVEGVVIEEGLGKILPFWAVFAVFFPAVTGIEAGIAMSGDLKNPSQSLPRGTLTAIGVSYLVYLLIPIFLAYRVADAGILRTHPLIMREIARWGDLVLMGLWGASLSSAMGSMLGAPRTLQALAKDGVIPRIIGKGYGPGNDPQIATGISFAIALTGILAGDLNMIAPVLSMFFLTSYGLLNISSGFEGLIGSPSWRPTFKIHWAFSFLGTALCIAVMLMIDAGATFMAICFSGLVYYIMERRSLRAHWGDVRYGITMLLAQYAIYRLSERYPDERTWRPNILVLSGSPTSRWYLIELADALSHSRGLLTVATIVQEKTLTTDRADNLRHSIKEYLKKRGVPAIVKIFPASDALSGIKTLIQTYGFGPVVPNTLLLGETEHEENFIEFARIIDLAYRSRKNLIIVRESSQDNGFSPAIEPSLRRIIIWWGGKRQNSNLMLALGYLMQTSPEWHNARLVLKNIVEKESDQTEALNRLDSFISEGRLMAESKVLIREEGKTIYQIIRENSKDADMVFLGMRYPAEGESVEQYSLYYQKLLEETEELPATAFVLAAENIQFHWIFR